MPLRNLLVPTDFSDVARNVYPYAANLSRQFNAAIHLVHFCSPQNWGLPAATQRDLSRLNEAIRQEAHLRSLSQAKIVSCDVIHERIQVALPRIARERQIDLAVMGKHGWSRALRFIVPSFSERIVRLADFPVLVIDPCSQNLVPRHRMTVLVPFDFTPSAHSALSAIQFLHTYFEAQFRFLYVSGPPKGRMQYFQALWLASGAGEPLVADEFALLEQGQLRGIDAQLVVRPGAPLQEILRQADGLQPDLIVMGTSGLLGAVAQNVVRHSDHCVLTCPANWVPHRDARDIDAARYTERLTSHAGREDAVSRTT